MELATIFIRLYVEDFLRACFMFDLLSIDLLYDFKSFS